MWLMHIEKGAQNIGRQKEEPLNLGQEEGGREGPGKRTLRLSLRKGAAGCWWPVEGTLQHEYHQVGLKSNPECIWN